MRYRHIIVGLALLVLPSFGSAADADSVEVLQALLRELRELRQTKYALREQWQQEKRGIEQMIRVDRARLETARPTLAATAKRAAELAQDVASATKEKAAAEQRLAAVSASLQASAARWRTAAASSTILMGQDFLTDLAEAAAPRAPPDMLRDYLHLLLETAQAGAGAETRLATITLAGKQHSGEVLRLGGALELFVSADDKHCGYRASRAASGEWLALPPASAKDVRQAMRVVNKELPARLVTVPVPRAAIADGDAAP